MQPGHGSGSEAGPKGDPGGKNQPVSEKENDLNDANCQSWPSFQADLLPFIIA
jgi:hypothetical protein